MSSENQGLPSSNAPLSSSQPPDYLVLSIFTILCCFWPLGVVALLKSIETRKHSQEGRQAEAETSSKASKLYNSIAIGIGIVVNVVVWLIVLVSVVIQIATAASVSQ